MNQQHTKTEVRLARIIQRAAAREGSFSQLEAQIIKAHARAQQDDADGQPDDADAEEADATQAAPSSKRKRTRFDRRKLKAIAHGETNVSITLDELLMLDEYLVPFGDSLALRPIFERPDVLHMLSQRRRVEFLLCAREDTLRKSTSMADNDVLAMTELQRKISRSGRLTQLAFRDVIVKTDRDEVLSELDIITHGLFENSGPSLVAIAAPRVCSPSERMLCKMFDVPEYTPQPLKALPFHFIWPEGDHSPLKSSFDMSQADIPEQYKDERVAVADGARALIWNDAIRLAEPPSWKKSRDVGVICVQQRSSGELWVCLAGLSGLGTYAAALMLEQLGQRIPQPLKTYKHGAVLWAVVEAALDERNTSRPGLDIRRLIKPKFTLGTRIWGGRQAD